MYRYVCVALVRLCLCTCVIAAWAAPLGAQSLADVARTEENRRKSIAEPGKVYTNKDLKPAPTPAPPPAAEPKAGDKADDKGTDPAGKGADKAGDKSGDTSASADKSTEKTAAPAEPVRDQKYWVARLKAVQEQLERDQTYADALQSRINALTTDFVNRDDPAQKNVIEWNRIKAIAELDRLKQAIPNDKKAIENLLEEARRAGVPPGWLR